MAPYSVSFSLMLSITTFSPQIYHQTHLLFFHKQNRMNHIQNTVNSAYKEPAYKALPVIKT